MTTTYNFAAIDIGSNAVRLLIKGIHSDEPITELSKVFIVRVPLRLGQDTFTIGRIGQEKIGQLENTIKAFSLLMKVYNVISYRACATSAMREAQNGEEVVTFLSKETGIDIEIINGEEEARIICDSHIVETLKPHKNYIFVDVGGGSTEISVIHQGKPISSRSYKVGTVRMLNNTGDQKEIDRLIDDVKVFAEKYKKLSIIGSGGNINKLNKLSSTPPDKSLKIKKLIETKKWLQSKTIEERIEEVGLKPDRADVIIPAADIFIEIAKQADIKNIWVPTIGIVDGITYSLCDSFLNNNN